VLLEPSEDETGILDFHHEVDGSGGCYLHMPAGGSARPASHETVDQGMHYIRQDGAHVFKYASRKMAEVSRGLIERNKLRPDEIDLFVAHQANLRIIKAAQERLELPDAKVVVNIQDYGNTTAATIPLALGTALDQKRLKPGHRIVLAAVGAGFTVGAVLMRWAGVPWE
jgi:3-oxoacyl-[acyl-carrier-protein] synthase-3